MRSRLLAMQNVPSGIHLWHIHPKKRDDELMKEMDTPWMRRVYIYKYIYKHKWNTYIYTYIYIYIGITMYIKYSFICVSYMHLEYSWMISWPAFTIKMLQVLEILFNGGIGMTKPGHDWTTQPLPWSLMNQQSPCILMNFWLNHVKPVKPALRNFPEMTVNSLYRLFKILETNTYRNVICLFYSNVYWKVVTSYNHCRCRLLPIYTHKLCTKHGVILDYVRGLFLLMSPAGLCLSRFQRKQLVPINLVNDDIISHPWIYHLNPRG